MVLIHNNPINLEAFKYHIVRLTIALLQSMTSTADAGGNKNEDLNRNHEPWPIESVLTWLTRIFTERYQPHQAVSSYSMNIDVYACLST